MIDESKSETWKDGEEEITPLPQVYHIDDGMKRLMDDLFDADEEDVEDALNDYDDDDHPIITEPIEAAYINMFKRIKSLSDMEKTKGATKMKLSPKATSQFNAILTHLNHVNKTKHTIDTYFKITLYTDYAGQKGTKGDNKKA